MTVPRERKSALISAKKFLRSLLDPKQTPKVPKSVRREAYSRLKHYPSDRDIEQLAAACPDILEPESGKQYIKGYCGDAMCRGDCIVGEDG